MTEPRPLPASMVLCPPANPGAVDRLQANAPGPLPDDYLGFLAEHDGGQIVVEDWCVFLWKAEQLLDFNREYEVERYAPGLFLFASNGCGDAYGFDFRPERDGEVVLVPFIGMGWSMAEYLAPSFGLILQGIAAKIDAEGGSFEDDSETEPWTEEQGEDPDALPGGYDAFPLDDPAGAEGSGEESES